MILQRMGMMLTMICPLTTDAEASKYSFLDRLKHYMERALITEDNRKAVELAVHRVFTINEHVYCVLCVFCVGNYILVAKTVHGHEIQIHAVALGQSSKRRHVPQTRRCQHF